MNILEIAGQVPGVVWAYIAVICTLFAIGALTSGYSRDAQWVGGRGIDIGTGWVSAGLAIIAVLAFFFLGR